MCFIYNCVPNQIYFLITALDIQRNTIKNVTIKYQILRMLITTQHGYRHIYSLATSGDWHGLVTCGCRSRGRGSRSCSRRVTAQARALGLGLSASIHQADTNHTGSKLRWKTYLSVIENGEYVQPIFCISIQSLPPPMIYVSLNQALNQNLYGVLFPSMY